MEGEVAKTATQVGWTVFQFLAPIVVATVTWLSARLSGLIRAKTKNELAAGMMIRLNESVTDAVKAVNQEMTHLLGRAKHPSSHGGTALTRGEAARLKQHAVEYVRSYWGPRGLEELARVLGFSSMMPADSGVARVEKLILTKVEAEVGSQKLEKARTVPM